MCKLTGVQFYELTDISSVVLRIAGPILGLFVLIECIFHAESKKRNESLQLILFLNFANIVLLSVLATIVCGR